MHFYKKRTFAQKNGRSFERPSDGLRRCQFVVFFFAVFFFAVEVVVPVFFEEEVVFLDAVFLPVDVVPVFFFEDEVLVFLPVFFLPEEDEEALSPPRSPPRSPPSREIRNHQYC